jgi:dihydrofolate synthase/folylpolyglutamate synthase
LDATNVCDKPLVAIITSISREHWQRLGPTLADIAGEKAGVLKPGSPAVVGKLPPEAREVVEKRIASLGCPAVWVDRSCPISSPPGESLDFASYNGLEYPLPLLGEVQLLNSAIAIAAIQVLQEHGWSISIEAIQRGMAETKWPGRLQWITWRDRRLLIDGAHNPAAARVLRQYIDSLNVESVTWVMGMLSTKDHADVFQELLRGGDRLYLVPVPGHSSAIPEELAAIAESICPNLESTQTYPELFAALERVVKEEENLIVLCGSLYLIGHFFRVTGKMPVLR